MISSDDLRPFQKEAISIAFDNFLRNRNTILALPPGTGKSTICIFIIKEVLSVVSGKILLILPGKAIEYQYRHRLENELLDRLLIASSPNRKRLDELNSGDVRAVIFEPLDNFPTKITEHVSAAFPCPVIVFTSLPYPPIEMIREYKGPYPEVDFRITIQDVIEEKVLERSQAPNPSSLSILQQQIQQLSPSDQKLFERLLNNVEAYQTSVEEMEATLNFILQSGLSQNDLRQLGYRKKELAEFEKLINDPAYFESIGGNERVWQEFFERNTWIFGYSLTFIFNEPLKGKKLEQVVSGYSVREHGKRTDALMRSNGVISALCFIEIKSHKTRLLKDLQYREESWPVSNELAGGIAQVQKTLHLSRANITSKLDLKNSEGFSDETIYMYRPKTYLIIGSLSEFTNEAGQISESKHSSFELFRRSLDIEIITFDELYYRAKAIVESQLNQPIP